MTQQFHRELEALKQRVARMASLSRTNLVDGVKSLADLDMKLADVVIARDHEINRLDVEIERDALELLARNQPMAIDLRTLGATLKIITYLDRIGRYGYDIAQAAKAMQGKEHVKKLVTLPHMANLAAAMLDDAMKAFAERNAQMARAVGERDEVVDGLNDQTFRECVTFMIEDPRTIGVCAHYILVARHLERAADNAAKIAEKTLYMVTGERRLVL